MIKKFASFMLSFVFVLSCFSVGANAQQSSGLEEIYETIDSAIKWAGDENGDVINDSLVNGAGTTVNDWLAFAVGRLGRNEDYNSYITALADVANNNGEISVTDSQRMSLAMLSCGGNPKECGLYGKAVTDTLNNDNLYEQKVNTLIFALLTLDSVQYKLDESGSLDRTSLINAILSHKLENGAFALNGDIPDTDITAMVLYALSPYRNSGQAFNYTVSEKEMSATVRQVIDDGLEYLASIQQEDGDMPSWGTSNCESTAQTIVALCSVGVDLENDERFIKNGKTLIDGLMKYQTTDGGFSHIVGDGVQISNGFATVQAIYSLTAYCRFKNGYSRLFDMGSEFSNDEKIDIDALNNKIFAIKENSIDVDDLENLLKSYNKLTLWERTYVSNFYILADALAENNIENTAYFSVEDIGVNTSVNGTVVNITADNVAEQSGVKIETLDNTIETIEISSATQNSNNASVWEIAVLFLILTVAVATLVFKNLKKTKTK